MNVKKAILVLLVVFIIFWMVTDPNGLADTTKTLGTQGWEALQSLFGSVIDFFGEL